MCLGIFCRCRGSSPKVDEIDEQDKADTALLKTPENTKHSESLPTTKFVFIGDTACGKTSIINRIENNRFRETQISTIGAEFKVLYSEINNQTYKLTLWDTAGQERYDNITLGFYRNTDCFVIVYDLSNNKSGENIVKWLDKIEKNTDTQVTKPHRIVVGNKMDLEKRELDPNRLAELIGNVEQYVECSARSGDNLDRLLKHMSAVAVNKHKRD